MMGKPSWSRYTFDNRLAAYGGKDVDKDFLPGFRNEAGIQAMRTYKELIRYVPPQFKDFGWEEANDFFLQGDAAMMEQWPGLSKAAEGEGSRIRGKIGYAVVPGVGEVKAPTLGGWSIGIVRKPERPESGELAYKFIEYVTSRDMELLKIPSGNDPTRISNYKRREVAAANPIYPVLAESLAKAKVLADPDVPFVTFKLDEIEENAVQDVIWGRATPEEAIDRMADSFNRVISATGLDQ
jgi:ABC-type glycerol-3-phosphate transport system substrate-binding protein